MDDPEPVLALEIVDFFSVAVTSSSLSLRYAQFWLSISLFDSVYVIVDLIFLSSLDNVALVESPSPHFRFVSLRFISEPDSHFLL